MPRRLKPARLMERRLARRAINCTTKQDQRSQRTKKYALDLVKLWSRFVLGVFERNDEKNASVTPGEFFIQFDH